VVAKDSKDCQDVTAPLDRGERAAAGILWCSRGQDRRIGAESSSPQSVEAGGVTESDIYSIHRGSCITQFGKPQRRSGPPTGGIEDQIGRHCSLTAACGAVHLYPGDSAAVGRRGHCHNIGALHECHAREITYLARTWPSRNGRLAHKPGNLMSAWHN
jgi:hypothetical protein